MNPDDKEDELSDDNSVSLFNANADSKDKEQEEPKLICKTTVKSKYRLTPSEMNSFTVLQIQNRMWKSAAPVTLFKEKEVIDFATKKYDCSVRDLEYVLDQFDKDKEKKRLSRASKAALKSDSNRKELVDALDKMGVTLRNDSSLCLGYITGTLKGWTLNQIVERMCQMKYLYEYCDMDKWYEEALESARECRRQGYEPLCSVMEEAEDLALLNQEGPVTKKGKKIKQGYPSVWPWLSPGTVKGATTATTATTATGSESSVVPTPPALPKPKHKPITTSDVKPIEVSTVPKPTSSKIRPIITLKVKSKQTI